MPPRPEPGPHLFLYCPQCGREFPYTPLLDGKSCPRCGADDLIGTKTSLANRSQSYGALFAAIMFELVAVMGLLIYVSRPAAAEAAEAKEYHTMRRDHCQKKLRFDVTKVGKPGRCTRCKKEIIFTEQPS